MAEWLTFFGGSFFQAEWLLLQNQLFGLMLSEEGRFRLLKVV